MDDIDTSQQQNLAASTSTSTSSQQQQQQEELPVNYDVYKNVGRDSELGRLLFNVYNKGRVNYTPTVNIKTKPIDPQKAHEEKRRAEAQAKKRKEYKIRTRAAQPFADDMPHSFSSGVRRKPQVVIAAELRQLEEEIRTEMPRHVSYEMTRDEQKKRLQDKFGGEQNEDNGIQSIRRKQQPPTIAAASLASQKSEDELLHDQLLTEIKERQDFLEEMNRLGNSQYNKQVTTEIQLKLQELKQVLKRLKQANK